MLSVNTNHMLQCCDQIANRVQLIAWCYILIKKYEAEEFTETQFDRDFSNAYITHQNKTLTETVKFLIRANCGKITSYYILIWMYLLLYFTT